MNVAFFNNYTRSKIDLIEYQVRHGPKVRLMVKRDDLIDPLISGNKWRKLKFNIEFALRNKEEGIATFGGAYSNHIAATASAGKRAGLKTIGFIRTHKIDPMNPTLAKAKGNGMKLVPLSRLEYKDRQNPEFIIQLQQQYPNYFFVPEGGSNDLSEPGIKELANECLLQEGYRYIATPIGSGGTINGLISAMPDMPLIGVAAVNDTPILDRISSRVNKRSIIHSGALFGGYAKFNDDLIDFCLDFFKQTGIPIEPIYSGKMFYALCNQRHLLGLADDDVVLAIHTGGLQGLEGFIQRNLLDSKQWEPLLVSLVSINA